MKPELPELKILFVCMGNICRSPAAEGMLGAKLDDARVDREVEVDSAGTIGYHTGKPPDRRMCEAAERRGIGLQHRARQVTAEDLDRFDLIIVMDDENLAEVKSLDPQHRFTDKIKLFCEFCTHHDQTEVPDPYNGGASGFELVLDLLDDGCDEIVRRIQASTLLGPVHTNAKLR